MPVVRSFVRSFLSCWFLLTYSVVFLCPKKRGKEKEKENGSTLMSSQRFVFSPIKKHPRRHACMVGQSKSTSSVPSSSHRHRATSAHACTGTGSISSSGGLRSRQRGIATIRTSIPVPVGGLSRLLRLQQDGPSLLPAAAGGDLEHGHALVVAGDEVGHGAVLEQEPQDVRAPVLHPLEEPVVAPVHLVGVGAVPQQQLQDVHVHLPRLVLRRRLLLQPAERFHHG